MEDNSMNSMSKLSISCDAQSTNDHHHSHDLDVEESGWTMYFEDFYAKNMDGVDDDCDCDELNNNNHSNLSSASGYETSLVSDAASSAAAGKKVMSNDHHDDQKLAIRSSLGQNSKKLSFKKRRSFKGPVLVDDALEDTASSPANSPKVSYLNEVMTMNPKEKKNLSMSKAKGSTYGQVDDERKAMDFIGRDSDCSELKKRGLCLVPLSMVANYLG